MAMLKVMIDHPITSGEVFKSSEIHLPQSLPEICRESSRKNSKRTRVSFTQLQYTLAAINYSLIIPAMEGITILPTGAPTKKNVVLQPIFSDQYEYKGIFSVFLPYLINR